MARPKGGPKFGGRKKGTPNRVTADRVAAMQRAAANVQEALGDAFAGDAHSLLMAIYKDPMQAWELRIDAAKAAVRYEKPALASIESRLSGEIDVRTKEHRDAAVAAALRANS